MDSISLNNLLGEFQIVNSDVGSNAYVSRYAGRFFNGYSEDLLALDTENNSFVFSRDGLFRILPESLFFDEQYLCDSTTLEDVTQKMEETKRHRELLDAFFEPFDTILEQRMLELHTVLDDIESENVAFVLKELYDVDIRRIHNPHVRRLARLLLDGDKLKGDIKIIPFYVRSILGFKTSCRIASRVVDEDASIYHTELKFIIYIEGLSADQYRKQMDDFEEFFWYLEQWFLPFDCEVDFCIKDYQQKFVLGQQMVLDYNISL